MNRRGELCLVVSSVALCSLLSGCASQGPLRPPSLNLPAAVQHLGAKRIGRTIVLTWTNPAKTSDGVSLAARHGAGALTAEICRFENALTDSCTPLLRFPVHSGEASTQQDVLPLGEASGPVRSLYYRVRVVNARGKGAMWSEVTTAAGAAPETLKELQAFPMANGILLRWKRDESAGRVMLRVSRGADTAKSVLLSASPLTGMVTGQPVRHPSAPEWMGTVDTGGRVGQEQRYIGFRVTTTRVGNETVSMQSDPVSVTVPATAKLPLPAPPTALEAVANTLGTPEVDLVWQPPDDVSVTGYRVYRQDDAAQTLLLTPEPLTGFTFADRTAQAAHRYSYRVSAVNPSGESSAATATVLLP